MMAVSIILFLLCAGYIPAHSAVIDTDTVWVADAAAEERLHLVEQSLTPFEHFVGTSRENETSTIQERMARWRVSGASLAVMKDFRLDWAKAYGQERPGGPPVSLQTQFQVASLSKFLTAVPVLTRVAHGDFSLDANINDLLTTHQVEDNEFTAHENVTLRGIMSHTSGLSQSTFPGYEEGQALPDVYQILKGEPPANTPAIVPIFEPGSRDRYSGGGNMVEQLLLVERGGIEFQDLMEQEVLMPLGMNHTTFYIRDRTDLADVASGCRCSRNQPEQVPGHWNQYPEQAAAGLWSRPADLLLFTADVARGYRGEGGLVPPALAQDMLTIQLPDRSRAPMMFGLGPNVIPLTPPWFHHWGYNRGYCLFLLASAAGDGVMFVTNSDCAFMQPFLGEVYRAVVSAYGWHDLRDNNDFPSTMPWVHRAPMGLPRKDPQDYEGVYAVPADAGALYSHVRVTRDSIQPLSDDACSWRLYPHPTNPDKLVAEVLTLYRYLTAVTHPVPLTLVRWDGRITGLRAVFTDRELLLTRTDDVDNSSISNLQGPYNNARILISLFVFLWIYLTFP